MGTSKRLVLASVVSLMMVLALGIGLLPTYTAQPVGAADGARADASSIFAEYFGVKQVSDVVTTSSADGLTVLTPEDNAVTPEIIVPLGAAVAGADGGTTVTYVAEDSAVATGFDPAVKEWSGDDSQVAGAFSGAGFPGDIDLGLPFYQAGVASLTTIVKVYALANATQSKAAVTVVYEEGAAPNDTATFTLSQRPSSDDADNNAIPDDAFNLVDEATRWIANSNIDGAIRRVYIANLDEVAGSKQAGTVQVQAGANVSVEVPDLAALLAATELNVPADATALVLVSVVDNLAAAVDRVDGAATPAARQQWAADVGAIAPADMALASFVEISLLYTHDGGTQYQQITSLEGTGLSVSLTLENIDMTGVNEAQLWSYPTMVSDLGDGALFLTNEPGLQSWTLVPPANTAVAGNTLTATFEHLSLFAPFDAGLALSSASPNRLPTGFGPVDVTLTGVIPVNTALSVSEANAAYSVTVAGVAATFTEGPAKQGVAITAYDGVNPNTAYISVPAIGAAGLATVQLTDLNNPGNSTSADLITVLNVFTISTAARDLQSGAVESNPASVSLSPARSADLPAAFGDGQFFAGDAAVANYSGAGFVRWEISSGGINPTTGAFSVAGNATVTAVYDSAAPCWPLTLQTQGTGTIVVTPELLCYRDGSQVQLEAIPGSGQIFLNWIISGANVVEPGKQVTSNPVVIEITADATVTAVFGPADGGVVWPPAGDAEPFGATESAWLFGGVVAEVNAAGLSDGDTIRLSNADDPANTDVAEATVFVRTAGVAEVIIPVAPASWFAGGAASVEANVTAIDSLNNESTSPDTFTYKQYAVGADGVNTTAFVFDPDVDNTIAVWDGTQLGNITLELPVLDTTLDQVFGIARNVQIDVAKQTTPPLSALGTANLDAELSAAEAGDLINRAFDFSMHFYGPLEASKQTPPVGSGAFAQNNELVTFERTVDVNGNPVQTGAALLTFPVTGSGLTAGDVREGLLMWGIELEYDYVVEGTVPLVPQAVEYQSELLRTEVSPQITAGTSNAAGINLVNQARLYSLNGFSLRQNAIFDADVAAGIRLDTPTGTYVANNTNGGNALTIVSARGGLGYVDRVVFRDAAGAKAGGTVTSFPAGSSDGTTEYELALQSPRSNGAGIVDLVIYLRSNPAVPAATLERVFEYKSTAVDPTLFLILLGLIIAILGLAAGGESGGGGGGPCFIATAAYGTPLAGQIDVLRGFRDSVLLESAVGSAFVDAYYTVSPAIADVVAQSPLLAAIVRVLLQVVIVTARVAMAMPVLSAALALMGAALLVVRRRARRAEQ